MRRYDLRRLQILLSLLALSVSGVAWGQAVYVPPAGGGGSTASINHTNPTGTTELLSTVINASNTHFAPTLSNWFRGGTSGKKIAIVGDSTSDQTGNAVSLYGAFSGFLATGDALSGVTILDFGTNGQTGAAFLSGRGSGTSTSTLTSSASGTTTTIVTANVTGIGVSTILTSATGTAGNIGQVRTVTATSGSGPYTVTVSPAFTSATTSGDTFSFANKNWTAVVAAAPDLIVLSFGINDVRQGATTQAQLTTTLTSIINFLRTDLPNCDIILRVPNALAQEDLGLHYVTTSGAVIVDQATNANGAVAQDYSDRIWGAYKSLEGKFPNVAFLDVQNAISGRKSPLTVASSGMADQLHPGTNVYRSIAFAIASIASLPNVNTPLNSLNSAPYTYSQSQADRAYNVYSAMTGSAWTPWLTYPRVLEDASQFDFIAEGRLASAPTATSFSIGGGNTGIWGNGFNASKIQSGDLFLFYEDNYVWQTASAGGFNPGSTGSNATTSSIIIAYTSGQNPATSGTKGIVRIFRRKFQGDATLAYYAQATGTYPNIWRAKVIAAGNGYLYLGSTDGNVKTLKTGDIIVAPGQTPYTVGGDTINYSAGYPQMTGSATNFTTWSGVTGLYVMSARVADTQLKPQEILKFNTTPGTVLAVSATSIVKQIVARPGRYNTVFAKLGTAGTGGNTIVTISRGGAVVLTLTFATASTTPTLTWASGSSFYVTPLDVMSAEVTTITGTPSDLTVTLDNN